MQILSQIKSLGGVREDKAGTITYSDVFKEWVLSDHPTPAKAAAHRPGETRKAESAKRAERRARSKRSVVEEEGQPVKRARTNRNFFHPDAVKQLQSEGKRATAQDVAKLWDSMTPEEWAPYDAMAAEDQARYYNDVDDRSSGPRRALQDTL